MKSYNVEATQFYENIQNYLKQENHLYDVTLAIDDGQQIKAHKLVLSAGSLYFRDIFEKVTHPQPYIHLGGFSKYQLDAVIEFLYNGRTEVDAENWGKFESAATFLRVVGFSGDLNNEMETLAENDVAKQPEFNTAYDNVDTLEESVDVDVDIQGINESLQDEIVKDIKTSKSVKSEKEEPIVTQESKSEIEKNLAAIKVNNETVDSGNDTEEINIKTLKEENISEEDVSSLNYDDYIEAVDGVFECKVCHRSSVTKRVLKSHVELHMPEALVKRVCQICGKTLRYSNTYRRHMLESHARTNNRVCNVCGRSYREGRNFNRHWKICSNSASAKNIDV